MFMSHKFYRLFFCSPGFEKGAMVASFLQEVNPAFVDIALGNSPKPWLFTN